MAYHNSVLSQLLKLLPRLEFEKQANRVDGKRRSDALSRWSQFVALTIGQLGDRQQANTMSSLAISSPGQQKRSPIFTNSDGRLNCSSNGLNKTSR